MNSPYSVFPGRPFRSGAATAVLLGLVLGACSSGTPTAHHATGTRTTTTTTAGVTAQSTTSTTAGAATTSSTTSTTNPPEQAAPGAPISVASPATGATVASPLTVTGTSRLGTQAIEVQLTDGAGNLLSQAVAHPGTGGAFRLTMRFAVGAPGPGSLALFVSSSGSRSDLTQVPVQLSD